MAHIRYRRFKVRAALGVVSVQRFAYSVLGVKFSFSRDNVNYVTYMGGLVLVL